MDLVPCYLCQVIKGKPGKPPSSGLRLAQSFLRPSPVDLFENERRLTNITEMAFQKHGAKIRACFLTSCLPAN